MSLKKVLTFALALFITGGGLQAQKLIVGADFTTRFDNREYANNDFNESQTLSAPGSHPGSAWNGWTKTG
jgi:hypothetical protein